MPNLDLTKRLHQSGVQRFNLAATRCSRASCLPAFMRETTTTPWHETPCAVPQMQGSGGTVDPASLSGNNPQAATSAVQQGVQGELVRRRHFPLP